MSEIPEFLDQDPVFDNDPISNETMPWHQVWLKVITKPGEQTFREISAQPGANAKTAYLWVFISFLVTFFVVALLQSLIGLPMMAKQFSSYGMGDFPAGDMGFSVIGLLCTVPFGAIFAVLGFVLITAVVQWVAKLFGGTGSYDQLVYPFASIYAPLTILSGLISALGMIPLIGFCFGIVSLGIGIYQVVLQVFAVQAVNDLDTGKAAGAVLLPALAIFIFICCCVFLVMLLAGPMIGNVFSEIQQSLY